MTFRPTDRVKLKGDKRHYVVCVVYPDAHPPEALIDPMGEAWVRPTKLVPLADLTLIADLEDFD